MSTPVVENIGSFIETAISQITVANGYNFDLTSTRAKRYFLEDEVFNDLTAYILQGRAETKGQGIGATNSRLVKQEFLIWVVACQSDRATVSIDTKLNKIKADVMKKLCADPTCGGYAKHLDITGIEPTDVPETGVLLTIEVSYCTVWNNPYQQA